MLNLSLLMSFVVIIWGQSLPFSKSITWELSYLFSMSFFYNVIGKQFVFPLGESRFLFQNLCKLGIVGDQGFVLFCFVLIDGIAQV